MLDTRQNRGFTIVELLIVIIVIAVLATITVVAFRGIQDRAKVSAVKSAVSQAVKKATAYAVLNSEQYPSTLTQAGLTSDASVTYEISANNSASPKQYCVTASIQGLTYFQTNTMNEPTPGTCIGMLAWWPFNGDANDKSGNGINGTVNGATLTSGVSDQPDSAFQLGGTAQYINIGTPASFTSLSTALTYSVWLLRTGTATSQWPQIMGAADTHRDFGIRSSGYGVTVYAEWGLTPFDGASFTGTGSSGSLSSLNEWHHMAVTFDGTIIRSYWDGVLRTTSGSTALRPGVANFSFTTSTSGWSGKIDDARVYSRALATDEVSNIYRAGAQ